MPPTLARLRRTAGRLVGGGADPTPAPSPVVSLTVRSATADGADLRLLVDVRVDAADLEAREVERTVLALVVPAAARWVRRHTLAELEQALGPVLDEVAADVRAELAGLDVDLVAVELVAAEHLLASPSGVTAGGPD